MDSKNNQNHLKNQTYVNQTSGDHSYKNQIRFVLLSLLFHFLFGTTLFSINQWTPPAKERIEISFMTPEELARLNEHSQDQKPEDKKEKRQIVDQAEKAINNELDPNAKFLSHNNQVVKKQTISQNRGEFRNGNGMGQNPAPLAKQKSDPISKTVISKSELKEQSKNLEDKIQKNKDQSEKDEKNNVATKSQRITVEDLAPKLDFSKMYENHMQKEKELEKHMEQVAKSKQEQRDSQSENSSELNSEGLASQTIDYIKELEPGLETLLTTREFVYFTFYSRIRNQLNQYWGPMVRERLTKLFSEGRTIASSDDKVTKILVTLDNKGTLIRVQIIGDSGVRDLDEAAVDAFRKASPFPNPPRGIIDSDGTIKIRWDFILEA